jgi:ferredoxin, 2Fe-2S
MPVIHVKTRAGELREIEATVNQSLMEALRDHGIEDIEALCGGSCACATCHVYINERFRDRLPPLSDGESDLLDASDRRQAGSRLSCQIPLTTALDGIELEVAPAM